MAGGIAITTLAGGNLKARIEGNIIKDNRYGITAYGNNVGSVIRGNEIVNNDTQGLPMLGGSGINFFGNSSNQSLVAANIITGNLWGITIQQEAKPNFGQMEGTVYNTGENQIFDNGNEGEVFNLYNNTPDPIMAQNNWWGSADPDTVESGIFHQVDDPSLGEVIYLPLFNPPVSIDDFGQDTKISIEIYPNPAAEFVFIKLKNVDNAGEAVVELMDANGKILADYPIENKRQEFRIELPEKLSGLFFLRLVTNQYSETRKLLIH
jgi:parallel beta-helix repeat protein